MSELELAELVREALLHLYETSYLQTHPLALRLAAGATTESPGRVLHRRLLDAIEQMKPPVGTPEHSLAWRNYRFLKLRYVDCLEHSQAAAALGVTERHLQRVRREAVAELTTLLFGIREPASSQKGAVETLPQPRVSSERELLESEWSRVDAAGEPPASLRETVRGVVQTLEPLARSVGVELSVSLDPRGDASTDRTLLRQTLFNLLIHAIRAQPNGKVSLSTVVESPRTRLVVVVRSSHPVESTAGPDADEHLAIAQRLAAMGDARVGVERLDDSYRLTLDLPAVALPSRRVLLVDDNPDFLLLFRRYLTTDGFEVFTASDGAEALRLAQAERPDVITLDVLMPHQDGWETLQRLKHHVRTRHIPVIVCSVMCDRDLAFSLGASDFLPKPVERPALLGVLNRFLRPEAPRDSGVASSRRARASNQLPPPV